MTVSGSPLQNHTLMMKSHACIAYCHTHHLNAPLLVVVTQDVFSEGSKTSPAFVPWLHARSLMARWVDSLALHIHAHSSCNDSPHDAIRHPILCPAYYVNNLRSQSCHHGASRCPTQQKMRARLVAVALVRILLDPCASPMQPPRHTRAPIDTNPHPTYPSHAAQQA